MEQSEIDKTVLRKMSIGIFITFFVMGMIISTLGSYIKTEIDNFIITIPEEERVYTEATITKIETYGSGENTEYDVYGILKNDEEEKERELNFYYTGLAKGKTIEVYYREGDLSYITCKEVEFPIGGPDKNVLNTIFNVSLVGFIITMITTIGFKLKKLI
ncbi:MAG: hypothetical protein IJ193_04380 [Bacilli bacterium]|nr:hypothetical protein [Bacilli bacterium]